MRYSLCPLLVNDAIFFSSLPYVLLDSDMYFSNLAWWNEAEVGTAATWLEKYRDCKRKPSHFSFKGKHWGKTRWVWCGYKMNRTNTEYNKQFENSLCNKYVASTSHVKIPVWTKSPVDSSGPSIVKSSISLRRGYNSKPFFNRDTKTLIQEVEILKAEQWRKSRNHEDFEQKVMRPQCEFNHITVYTHE